MSISPIIPDRRSSFFMSHVVRTFFNENFKKLAFRHLGLGKPEYRYNVEPIQLATVINKIEETRDLPGSIVEIGVARGQTTRFIAEHVAQQGIKVKMYALDTFSSFVDDDVRVEVEQRGKKARDLEGFGYNDFDVWKKNFEQFEFVTPIRADAKEFDFSSIAPIKVAFLDVDLYQPTKMAMAKIYPHLVEGGWLLVDDVMSGNRWDGAHQAFHEFVGEKHLPFETCGNKCAYLKRAAVNN